jgi:hypothetical protein
MYLENALRAQANYAAGLERRTSWGMRGQTIRLLTRQLEDSGLTPILQLTKAKRAADVLERWVNLRNRWAHAPFSEDGVGENLSGQEITQMLMDLFMPISLAHLHLVKRDQTHGLRVFLLEGLRGLFDPQPAEIPDPVGGSEERALVLQREGIPIVRLEPFFRYRSGTHEENRVEFLASVRDGVKEYVDPLPLAGAKAATLAGPERQGTALGHSRDGWGERRKHP